MDRGNLRLNARGAVEGASHDPGACQDLPSLESEEKLLCRGSASCSEATAHLGTQKSRLTLLQDEGEGGHGEVVDAVQGGQGVDQEVDEGPRDATGRYTSLAALSRTCKILSLIYQLLSYITEIPKLSKS